MSEQRVTQLVRTVAEGVKVGPAPVETVVSRGRRRERKRRVIAAGVVAVAAGAVVAGFLVGRPDHRASVPVGVMRVENPLPIPWWGDGTLHLAEVTVPAPDLSDLVVVEDAVGYGTESGDVVLVRPDGQRTTIGHKLAGAPLEAGSEEGWLSWVDPRDKAPQLVVYDVGTRTELGRVDLPYKGERWERLDAGSHPIAIDRGRVYYATQNGDWSWAPSAGEPRREGPADVDLLDVREGRRIAHRWRPGSGWAETLSVTRPDSELRHTHRGGRGWFSADAEHLAVRNDDGLLVFTFGESIPIRLSLPRVASGWEADLAFADGSSAVVVTGGKPRPESQRAGPGTLLQVYDTWDVSTCDLETGSCVTIADATTKGPPLLPE